MNQPSSYPQQYTQPYPQPYPQPYAQPYAAPAVDPGRGLGIAGLVLSIFFSLVGLIVSVVALRKSKRAGFRNGAALAGIVVGALTTLGLLIAGIGGAVALTSVVDHCQQLGPGVHQVDGVTYTCG